MCNLSINVIKSCDIPSQSLLACGGHSPSASPLISSNKIGTYDAACLVMSLCFAGASSGGSCHIGHVPILSRHDFISRKTEELVTATCNGHARFSAAALASSSKALWPLVLREPSHTSSGSRSRGHTTHQLTPSGSVGRHSMSQRRAIRSLDKLLHLLVSVVLFLIPEGEPPGGASARGATSPPRSALAKPVLHVGRHAEPPRRAAHTQSRSASLVTAGLRKY